MIPKSSQCPSISYRPVRPSDLEIIEQIHSEIFPIRYESEFFLNVVHGNGIVSWAAVDRSRSDGKSDELIGFITTRIIPAKESEIVDLLSYDSLKPDQTLVYILTLGVVESYRNQGIASSLIHQVIKYASASTPCRAVYLHVISYNIPAIQLYRKMSFTCVRRLQGFYLINGQHYDSYLFVYYLNGGQSRCSLLEFVTAFVGYMRGGLKLMTARFWRKEDRAVKFSKCKETHCLMPGSSHSRKIRTAQNIGFECV